MPKGQTLVEVLIAVALGVVLFTGAANLIIPAIKTNTVTNSVVTATALQKELLDNVSAWAGGNWNGILVLATTSAHTYYLVTTQSPFVATSGAESVTVNTTTFARYFYVDDVIRNSSGYIATSSGTYDPSTKKVTVVCSRPQGTPLTVSAYLTRNYENAYDQTDWSGGGGVNGPITTVGNQFSTSSNISFTSIPGSLLLITTGGSGAINSSSYTHWAWNDLIGWIDFWNNGSGTTVTGQGLTGYASSSVGQISLDCHTTSIGNICSTSTYQVANDGSGHLSGWAWNDSLGWIGFNSSSPAYQVTIDASGDFQGYAWNDFAGWISFNCDNTTSSGCASSTYKTQTFWTPSSTITGYLDSATFDTNSVSAQLISVLWQGTQPTSTTVKFQFAVSSVSSGPWTTFLGTDGTSNTYYIPLGPGVPLALSSAYTSNFRYFRYRIFIVGPNNASSAQVDNIAISWNP